MKIPPNLRIESVGGFRAYVAASALMDNARPLKLFSSNAGVPDIDICPVVKVGDEHLILKKMNVETVSLTMLNMAKLNGARLEGRSRFLSFNIGVAEKVKFQMSDVSAYVSDLGLG